MTAAGLRGAREAGALRSGLFACAALLVAPQLLADESSGGDARSSALATYAAASARPPLCAQSGAGKAALWQKARFPQAAQLCSLLLLGSARLSGDPDAAREAALAAAKVAPERAEPFVLLGRAELLSGQPKRATEAFERGIALDARALDAPSALLAAARADVLVGADSRALERYRRLVSRVSLLSEQSQRQRALLEASIVAQRVPKADYAEARAYAAEARREGALFFVDLARAAMALALDRMGQGAEARVIAAESSGPRALAWLFSSEPAPRGRADEVRPLLPPGEEHALLAILAEPVDRELSRDEWQAYLEHEKESGNVPEHLVLHAERRLRELGGPGR